MTAPGGFGESAHDDEANPSAAREASEPRDAAAPWAPPAAAYPPPAYPPPGYEQPPGYGPHPGYEQPPNYGPPPGYGPPAYQPGPPPFPGPAGGYGTPYPGSYYAAPEYQGGYGPGGALRAGTNGLAIASLIASFTGVFCCIGSIAAIVLGAFALGEIKRTRQEGYGLAVAGIVIGVAALIVNLVFVLFALKSR